MRIAATHVFSVPARVLMDVMDEDALEDRLAEASGMQREVIEMYEKDGIRHKRVRCRPKRNVPSFMKALVGGRQLEYDELNRTDLEGGVIEWWVEPPVFPERLVVKGITRVTEHPDGSQRVLEGEVGVKVRLLGGRIEKLICDDFHKSYDVAADRLRAYIRDTRR